MRLELSPLAVTDLQAIGDYIALDSPGNATPMSPYSQLQTRLQAEPNAWLVTGVVGFIGSNLADHQTATVFCHCGPRPAIHPARCPNIASGKNICQIGLQPPCSLRNKLYKQ